MRCKVVSRRQLGPFGSVSLIRTFDARIPGMRPVDRAWRGAASPGGCQKIAGRGAKQFLKVSWRKLRPCLFSLFPGSAGFLSRRDNWGLLRFFPSIRNACNSRQSFILTPTWWYSSALPALVTAASTARESVSKRQLHTGPGTFDRDFGLACYRKRVTDRSPDSKLGGHTYWARALSCALSCLVSWELVLALVLALFARCVLGAVFFVFFRNPVWSRVRNADLGVSQRALATRGTSQSPP